LFTFRGCGFSGAYLVAWIRVRFLLLRSGAVLTIHAQHIANLRGDFTNTTFVHQSVPCGVESLLARIVSTLLNSLLREKVTHYFDTSKRDLKNLPHATARVRDKACQSTKKDKKLQGRVVLVATKSQVVP
jgi:hypothetical protein